MAFSVFGLYKTGAGQDNHACQWFCNFPGSAVQFLRLSARVTPGSDGCLCLQIMGVAADYVLSAGEVTTYTVSPGVFQESVSSAGGSWSAIWSRKT